MTYKEILAIYKSKYGRTIKSCWIADIKRKSGLKVKESPNRINKAKVKHPCPEGEIKERLTDLIKTCYNIV